MDHYIVLVTGGCGFLGQHLIKELQDRDETVTEIRVVDLKPFTKQLDFKERAPLKSYICDVTNITCENEAIFENVSCIFHCAAEVSYSFPPNKESLQSVNVKGTRNIIKQCLTHKIPTLIYTSTAEVCLQPCFKNGSFGVAINSSEKKAVPPKDPSLLMFGEYAASKLEAEQLVLDADKTQFSDGGELRTMALRPTFMYGEGDRSLIPPVMQLAKVCHQTLYYLTGCGGRNQIMYAGNAAWGHICAKNSILQSPDSISGLPVLLTDDTRVDDLFLFTKSVTVNPATGQTRLRVSSLPLPGLFFFFLAIIFEFLFKLLRPIFSWKPIPFSPRSVLTYLGSLILFNRLRACIYLNFTPVYSPDDSLKRSIPYYDKVLEAIQK